MWTYFLKNPISHDLRKVDKVLLPPARLARSGINSLLLRGSLRWSSLSTSVKIVKYQTNLNSNLD